MTFLKRSEIIMPNTTFSPKAFQPEQGYQLKNRFGD